MATEPKKPKAKKVSYSAPQDWFDKFDSAWRAQRWDSASEYIRALFEAAGHYDLWPTQEPKTLERILRRRSEIDSETGGWVEANKSHKKTAPGSGQ